MMPRNLAEWDPIRDGSYIAALLDRAAEERDLQRLAAPEASRRSIRGTAAAWQPRYRQHAGRPPKGATKRHRHAAFRVS